MEITAKDGQLVFTHGPHGEDRFTVTLHRTLRLPEDGRTHGLPPSLGAFPIKLIDDYKDRVPAAWREHGGVFFPMWQREAMWLAFSSSRRPFACKVAAGKINAVSGMPWKPELEGVSGDLKAKLHKLKAIRSDIGEEAYKAAVRKMASDRLSGDEEANDNPDYIVAPPQPWLDGFNSGFGTVNQFIAMPLGMGYTVEGQVTGKEDVGGIQIMALPPKDGLLIPKRRRSMLRGQSVKIGESSEYSASMDWMGFDDDTPIGAAAAAAGAEMGLGQGGEMEQKIYPDPHGIETWDQEASGRLFIHIVNSQMYEQITGEKPPPSPITAQEYTHMGWPWFKLWDEEMKDVAPSKVLSGVKTVGQMDKKHGFTGQQDDSPLPKSPLLMASGHVVKDGSW